MFSLGALLALSLSHTALAAPTGGVGLNITPAYVPLSDYDFQSLNLALNQEFLELFLFQEGLARFSQDNFTNAGLTPDDQSLIQYMANQEVGHVDLLTNILGANASQACNYTFPFETVPEFIDLSARVTRVGESGVFGFLEHLDSRGAGALLGQAVAVESRQEMIFRQFQGLFPMPIWFIPAITQNMAWTLQAPFLASCPSTNPRVEWQNFPALVVTNAPNASVLDNGTLSNPAISTNRTALTQAGQTLNFTWELPGKAVGPDLAYNTSTNASAPQFAAWISQLNVTYTPLTNISNNSALTVQPNGMIFGDDSTPIINGTIFIVLTDTNITVTPFNLSQIDSHIVAGPAIYTSG